MILPALLAAASQAQAQQQAELPMAKVEVQGKAADYDPRRDDTATKIVVQHDELVKYGDSNLLDALRRVPGVTVSGTAGRNAQIRMRGLGSGYTQILVNGERTPSGFSIDTLAPDMIERVEVLRAATAEYSTESIAGTINFVLRKTTRKNDREIKLGYARGKDTNTPNADLRMSDRSDRFSYSVAANAMRDNFTGEVPSTQEEFGADGRLAAAQKTSGHENGNISRFNLVPRLNWALDGGDTLSSESAIAVSRMEVDLRAPVTTEVGPLPPYLAKDINMSGHRVSVQTGLRWMHKLAAGAQLAINFRVNEQKSSDTSYRNFHGNPDVLAMTRKIDSNATDHGTSSIGKYTVPLWDGHAFALGWDGRYDKRNEARRERDYTRADFRVPDGDEDSTAVTSRGAVYAQDEWNVTPAWSLYLGTRWEGVRLRADGNTFGATRSTYSVLSPVMQTLYKLPGAKGQQLRLALTRTYKAPGLQAMLSHLISINNNQIEPDVIGNPNLKPELATGVDAGYERFWGEGAMVAISASARRIADFTRYRVFLDGERWVSQAVNIGGARTESLELETKFPLTMLFAHAPALDLRASVARNWSRVDAVPGPDNRLDQQTPLSANLGLDYSVGTWTTGASFAFKNGGHVRVSAEQTAYVNVQRNLDLYALWKLDRKYQLRLSASNVLGQDMIREASYTSANGVLHNRLANVVNPNMRVTLEARF
ncbi:MAG: TonB-dependent receptor plug domain-containing protein [Telluria sp.]